MFNPLFQKRNLSLVLQTAVHFALYVPIAIASYVILLKRDADEEDKIDYDSFDYINNITYLSSTVSL